MDYKIGQRYLLNGYNIGDWNGKIVEVTDIDRIFINIIRINSNKCGALKICDIPKDYTLNSLNPSIEKLQNL